MPAVKTLIKKTEYVKRTWEMYINDGIKITKNVGFVDIFILFYLLFFD